MAERGDSLTFVHRGAFVQGGARVQAESDMTEAAATLVAAGQPMPGAGRTTRIVVDGETVYSQLGPPSGSPEPCGGPTDWTSGPDLWKGSAPGGATDNDTLAIARLVPSACWSGGGICMEMEMTRREHQDEVRRTAPSHQATFPLGGETSGGHRAAGRLVRGGCSRAAGVETSRSTTVWVVRRGGLG